MMMMPTYAADALIPTKNNFPTLYTHALLSTFLKIKPLKKKKKKKKKFIHTYQLM